MAGITVSDIMNANLLWTTSATSWADFLLGIQNNASYLDTNVKHPLSAAWMGTAAELATGKVSTAQEGLIKTASQLNTIQRLVEDFNSKLAGWQQQLLPLLNKAKFERFDVGEDGTVSIPPLSPPQAHASAYYDPGGSPIPWAVRAQAAQEVAENLQGEIQGILAAANRYDDETAAVLRAQMPTKGVAMQAPTLWKSKYSSLSQIAQAYYGNANLWPLIYNANRDQIKNPNLISTGMNLVIPAISGGTPSTMHLTPAEAQLLSQAHGTSVDGDPITLSPQQRQAIAHAEGVPL
jgi:hypothetical protein